MIIPGNDTPAQMRRGQVYDPFGTDMPPVPAPSAQALGVAKYYDHIVLCATLLGMIGVAVLVVAGVAHVVTHVLPYLKIEIGSPS